MEIVSFVFKQYYHLKRFLSPLLRASVLTPEPSIVANRVIEVFIKHGVQKNQIPRFFPKLSLSDLSTNESLVNKLTPQLIDEIADLFKVRVEWLEGIEDRIYDYYSCYKQPEKFFEKIQARNNRIDSIELRVITSVEKFDFESGYYQPFVLVTLEPIGELGEDVIYRYCHDTLWDWQHEPCRIQAKALAYLYRSIHRTNIPIFHTDYETLERISDGLVIPRPFVSGCLITDPSLEDYVMTPEQSVVSKESKELLSVKNYIEQYKLEKCIDVFIDATKDISINSDLNQTLQQKAAKAKHQNTYQLKRECVLFWLKNNNLSGAQAARKFYKSLDAERKKTLSPTNAERTLSIAISEFRRKDELAAQNKLPIWLEEFNP